MKKLDKLRELELKHAIIGKELSFRHVIDRDENIWIQSLNLPGINIDTFEFRIPSFVHGFIHMSEIVRVIECNGEILIDNGPRAKEFPEIIKDIEKYTKEELKDLMKTVNNQGFVRHLIINGNGIKIHGDLAKTFMSLRADTIKFKNIDASEIRNTRQMFAYQTLRHIDLSGITFGELKRSSEMFSGCRNLESIDISNISMRSDIDAELMFWQCTNLKEIKLPRIELGKRGDLTRLCRGCGNLIKINSENIIVKEEDIGLNDIQEMFKRIDKIERIDLSGIDYERLKNLAMLSLSVINKTDNLHELILKYPTSDDDIEYLRKLGLHKDEMEGATVLLNESSIKRFLHPILDRPDRKGIGEIQRIIFKNT